MVIPPDDIEPYSKIFIAVGNESSNAAFLTSQPEGQERRFLCRHVTQQGLYRFRKSENWRFCYEKTTHKKAAAYHFIAPIFVRREACRNALLQSMIKAQSRGGGIISNF